MWATRTLANVCTKITDGSHFSPSTVTSGYPYITVRDIKESQIDFKNCAFIEKVDFLELQRNGCNPIFGDVLFSKDGTVGKVALVESETDFVVLSSLAILRPNTSLIDPKYLSYVLRSPAFLEEAIGKKTGVAIRRIILKNLKQIPVPYPPLPEQQRIVTLLDEVFDGIATAKANAEKNLHNARAIFESHLQSVFTQRGPGWMEKKLEEIGKTQTGSTPKTSDRANYGDFISFVKPGDFNTDGTLDYDKDGLSESGAAGARKVPSGSVLMVCIGATIGKCGYCDQDVTTNQQVNALTPSDGSSNRFIYYQMLTESFQRKVIHASGQATLPIINKSKWSALPVWLPPTVAEQRTIAAKFDALSEEIQRLESIYQQKLTALDELKKSLLHRAFNGDL